MEWVVNAGTLYVVATPIGNLEDMTYRAVRILGEVDVIFAEDTRRARSLLSHYGLSYPEMGIQSCHDHNESKRIAALLSHLQQGRSVALVTDAGTPAISDPGYRLVQAVWQSDARVVPLPGACAAIAALSAGGLPTDRFTFAGFPPKKTGARRRWLDELATSPGTLILYAPARDVAVVLSDLVEVRGDPPVAVFRELTKQYETCLRGRASEVLQAWSQQPQKGEVTLLAGRAPDRDFDDATLLAWLREASPAQVAQDTGVSRRRCYQLSLSLRDE